MAAASAESLAQQARLEDIELLAHAEPAVVDALKGAMRLLGLSAGERLAIRAGEGEQYYFVLRGQLGVVLDGGPAGPPGVPSGRALRERKQQWQFISAFGPGDFFSDDYVRNRPSAAGPVLECVAEERCVVAAVPRAALQAAILRDPALRRALTAKNAELRRRYDENRSAARRLVQDFYLRHGLGFAGRTKVLQVDRCIGCDGCEDACARRHGVARLVRLGPSLGVLSFPVACRACSDHRCLDACAFDALTLAADGQVVLSRQACVGCSACALACPNGAIRMVEVPYIAADFPNPMPDTAATGETNVPGVYLVGEAAGAALIKVAINSGVRAIEAIAGAGRPAAAAGLVDVLIVGAGPAGLAAALTCRERGLSFQLFDKGAFATTIQEYPRHKLVMAEPAHLPLYGQLWLKDTTREELIAKWQEIIEHTGLQIRSGEAVKGVSAAAEGGFWVESAAGRYRGANVVLAVGTRGTPRRLGVGGETPARVKYALGDPAAYRDRHLLVVGGGDSAVEAAMSLADVSGTQVTLSYRKESFGRIKARNKSRLSEYGAAGRLQVLLGSTVERIDPAAVTLSLATGARTVANDVIFAMLGAEPPTKLFEAVGIRIVQPGTAAMEELAAGRGARQLASKCDRCHGFADAACITACPTGAIFETSPQQLFFTEGGDGAPGIANELPFLLGFEPRETGVARWLTPLVVALAVVGTIALGLEVFLRKTAPEMSVLARWLTTHGWPAAVPYESGRGLGLYLGIAGSVLMAAAAAYPLHSRLGWWRSLARRRWFMTMHVWAGVLGPVLVSYHTGLKLDRWPSLAFWAAWGVVLSGLVGRYLKSALRRGAGLAELEIQSLAQAKQRLRQKWSGVRGRTQILASLESRQWVAHPPTLLAPLVYCGHLVATTCKGLWLRTFGLRHAAAVLRQQTWESYAAHARATRRRLLAEAATRTVVWWRRFHLTITLGLVGVAVTHIVLGLLYRAH